MTYRRKVIKVLGPAEAHKHESRFWSIYRLEWIELGFGTSEENAWRDAWRRYSKRQRFVTAAADYTPQRTNH